MLWRPPRTWLPTARSVSRRARLLGGLLAYLNSQVPEDQSVNSEDLLYEARLIKTPWEIDMLRMAAQHAERVQSRVAQQLEPGMNALALDNMIMAAGWAEDKEYSMSNMAYQIGIGPYWGVSASPRNYVIKKGDLIRIDGGGTHFGYISDITRTWAVGGSPSSKHEETYDALYAGFLKGLTLLKPGVKMSEMYAEVRAEVEKSPIFPNYARGHVGHSISLSPLLEDHPLFAPGFDVEFQPGMCVSLETSYMAAQGAYAPGPYNIEDSFAITEEWIRSVHHRAGFAGVGWELDDPVRTRSSEGLSRDDDESPSISRAGFIIDYYIENYC
jgi:Xaa-Pro aminopeptidase